MVVDDICSPRMHACQSSSISVVWQGTEPNRTSAVSCDMFRRKPSGSEPWRQEGASHSWHSLNTSQCNWSTGLTSDSWTVLPHGPAHSECAVACQMVCLVCCRATGCNNEVQTSWCCRRLTLLCRRTILHELNMASGGVRVFAARSKRLCCLPHHHNQISNSCSYGYNDGISVDCEQYAKLGV